MEDRDVLKGGALLREEVGRAIPSELLHCVESERAGMKGVKGREQRACRRRVIMPGDAAGCVPGGGNPVARGHRGWRGGEARAPDSTHARALTVWVNSPGLAWHRSAGAFRFSEAARHSLFSFPPSRPGPRGRNTGVDGG